MRSLSIRKKITLWYTGLIVLILGVIFSAILYGTDEVLLVKLQHELEEEVYDAAEDIRITQGALDLGKLKFMKDGIAISLYDESHRQLAGQLPQAFPETALDSEVARTVRSGEHSWMTYDLRLTSPEPIWIRGVVSLSSTFEVRNRILLIAAALFPFLALLAGLGGWLITRQAFRPVARIRDAAAEIERGGDLSKRIHLTGSKDEIYDLAQTFDHMLGRLEQSFTMERQFTSDASHELRTPVSVILSHAEYGLSQADNPREMAQALAVVHHQAKKMRTLISCLLFLARADHHTEKLEFERIDLSETAEIVVQEVEIAARKKGMAIETRIAPDLVTVADQTSMMRLFLNLLQNAVQYGRAGGWIRFSLQETRRGIEGSVADNGIGIAPEHLPEIWNRFYQVDPSRKGMEDSGSGLGLSIVKWLIERHGGTITVESVLGEGTVFQFTLPSRGVCANESRG